MGSLLLQIMVLLSYTLSRLAPNTKINVNDFRASANKVLVW